MMWNTDDERVSKFQLQRPSQKNCTTLFRDYFRHAYKLHTSQREPSTRTGEFTMAATGRTSGPAPRIKLCPRGAHTVLLWPWHWPDDLKTRRWPRYSEKVHSHRKWNCYVKPFETPNRRWHMHGKWKLALRVKGHQPQTTSSIRHGASIRLPSYINFRSAVFKILCRQTDRQTDTTKNNTCVQHRRRW